VSNLRDQYTPHKPVRSYVVSIAISRYLQLKKIANPLDWVLDVGSPRIEETRVDIFNQTITFHERYYMSQIQPPQV
jgi:hypothetical protein